MDVKPLVSTDTWNARPCEYTDENGHKNHGIYICNGRRHGVEFCYIFRSDGVNVTVPKSQVILLDIANVRVQITIRR